MLTKAQVTGFQVSPEVVSLEPILTWALNSVLEESMFLASGVGFETRGNLGDRDSLMKYAVKLHYGKAMTQFFLEIETY